MMLLTRSEHRGVPLCQVVAHLIQCVGEVNFSARLVALDFGAAAYTPGSFGVLTYTFKKSRFDVLGPGVWSKGSEIIGMVLF